MGKGSHLTNNTHDNSPHLRVSHDTQIRYPPTTQNKLKNPGGWWSRGRQGGGPRSNHEESRMRVEPENRGGAGGA